MSAFVSKELIKEKLWQYAVEKWRIDDPEKSFDPLVDLLFGGLSRELEAIYHTVADTQNQLFGYLTEALLPDLYTRARPAHAIVGVHPEADISINETDTFKDDLDLHYSPAGTYDLLAADVLYMASGNELYSITTDFKKEPKMRFPAGKELAPGTIYIGIKTMPEFNAGSARFNLCFHLGKEGKVPYDDLPLTQVAHQDQNLTVRDLRRVEDQGRSPFMDQMKKLGLDSRLNGEVFEYYKQRFIQFDLESGTASRELPSRLEIYLTESRAEELKKESCIWISLQLSESWYPLIPSLICLLNSIPVVQRTLEKKEVHRPEPIWAERLAGNKNFLSLYKLEGDGKPYGIADSSVGDGDAQGFPGTFQLIRGGVHTMDSRGASVLINHLLDKVEESGSWSEMDFQKTIDAVQQFRKEIPHTDPGPVLLVNTRREGNISNLSLQYWSSPAFPIKQTRKKELSTQCLGLRGKKGFLLTEPAGSRAGLSMGHRLKKLRYALLSRDRICTVEDMRSFVYACFHEFELEVIDITPSVSSTGQSGLSRIWLIRVIASDEVRNDAKFRYLIRETESELNARSSGITPIKLIY